MTQGAQQTVVTKLPSVSSWREALARKPAATHAWTSMLPHRDYGRFMDAGYRGMYNRSLREIEALKGVKPREHLLDRMSRTELAANMFRGTLTEDKIEKDQVYGQRALEGTAHDVGCHTSNG